jgi:hypothetical protein
VDLYIEKESLRQKQNVFSFGYSFPIISHTRRNEYAKGTDDILFAAGRPGLRSKDWLFYFPFRFFFCKRQMKGKGKIEEPIGAKRKREGKDGKQPMKMKANKIFIVSFLIFPSFSPGGRVFYFIVEVAGLKDIYMRTTSQDNEIKRPPGKMKWENQSKLPMKVLLVLKGFRFHLCLRLSFLSHTLFSTSWDFSFLIPAIW